MGQQLISEVIPQTVIEDVSHKFLDIITALTPYTVGLSPEQRKELPKMGAIRV